MTPNSSYIDQCLFGYADGHRLLASSINLGAELTDLTELSDLAPGVIFGKSDGYWTGVPVPKIGRYALMRTWSAPEMPRPGCVWTHVILLAPEILECLPDLSVLTSLFRRPRGLRDEASYRDKVLFELSKADIAPRNLVPLTNNTLINLLDALYSNGSLNVLVSSSADVDQMVFGVWSQQWPRLRRNFRFQTAITRTQRVSSSMRFDFYLQSDTGELSELSRSQLAWLNETIRDLETGAKGQLRRFLRLYGHDVRRQRASFKPLVNINLLNRASELVSGSDVLELVAEAFPDRQDALTLKQALVDGQVVPDAQIDLIWFILGHGGSGVFPNPSLAGFTRLAQLWTDRPEELLQLAERTANSQDEFSKSLFEAVTGSISLDNFWTVTEDFSSTRKRMIMSRPQLLTSDGSGALDNKSLLEIIQHTDFDNQNAIKLVPKLLLRDDWKLASYVIERHPSVVASEAISVMNRNFGEVGAAWVQALLERPDVLLDSKVFSQIKRTSLIFELADKLGWLSYPVLNVGPSPWVSGMIDARNDVSEEKREMLETFFIAIALACGGDDGLVLIEENFERVHKLVLKSKLHWRAVDMLTPFLPDLGWLRNWDVSFRLRLAVASAFVRYQYSPESYQKLGRSKAALMMLAEAAMNVPDGQRLATICKSS